MVRERIPLNQLEKSSDDNWLLTNLVGDQGEPGKERHLLAAKVGVVTRHLLIGDVVLKSGLDVSDLVLTNQMPLK